MAQDDTVTFEKTPHFQLLPMSKVDQSLLSIHEVPPLQLPKSPIYMTNFGGYMTKFGGYMTLYRG